MLVDYSVGSNTNNASTPSLAVHSRHVATKPLRWCGGWAHWIVFMTSLCIYIYICIYTYIPFLTKLKVGRWSFLKEAAVSCVKLVECFSLSVWWSSVAIRLDIVIRNILLSSCRNSFVAALLDIIYSNLDFTMQRFTQILFRSWRIISSGSEFSSIEIELRNRVTQNDVTIRVTNSKILRKILLSSY